MSWFLHLKYYLLTSHYGRINTRFLVLLLLTLHMFPSHPPFYHHNYDIILFRSDSRHCISITICVCVHAELCPTVCDPKDCSAPGSSVWGIFQAKNTGVGSHFLFQGICPTKGLNPHHLCFLHWQADSLPLCHLGSPSLSMSVLFTFKPCSTPWLGEGDGTPLQYSCLENPMDGGAW